LKNQVSKKKKKKKEQMTYFLIDVELVTKITQSNEIMTSISRIANKNIEPDFADTSDIHVLAKRVWNILQVFKNSHPIEEHRRSAGQKQR
jgi:hypothetical protein